MVDLVQHARLENVGVNKRLRRYRRRESGERGKHQAKECRAAAHALPPASRTPRPRGEGERLRGVFAAELELLVRKRVQAL